MKTDYQKKVPGTFSSKADAQRSPDAFLGVTAFFDIMGYKQMLANNEAEDAAAIIRDIFHSKLAEVDFERIELTQYDLNPEYLIFSDSVLLYRVLEPHDFPHDALRRFVRFCSQVTGELLASGLPIRGAITKGRFSIVGGKSFTGKCIIEAYEIAQNIEMAGCVIAPALESEVLKDKDVSQEICYWQTPVKNSSPQEMLALDYSSHFEKSRTISRAQVIECYGAFKKDIGAGVLSKINNTIHFLEFCKQRKE